MGPIAGAVRETTAGDRARGVRELGTERRAAPLLGLDGAPLAVDSVGAQARAGARVGAVSQLSRTALTLAVTVVLARLLTPDDFGLVAGVAAVVALAEVLRDGGLSAATISARALTQQQASTLFWLNAAVGAALAGVLAASAPLVADFYDRPAMAGITVALAGSLLISSLGTQHSALLVRGMELRRLATAEVGGVVAGSACAIVAAAAGAGYWSLVVMQAVTAAVRTGLVWRLTGWRPDRPRRHAGVRQLVDVGGQVLLVNVLNYGSRHLDNVIVGRVAGTEALGLYSRAYALLLAPLQQVNAPATTVAVPTLSRLSEDPQGYRRFYLRLLQGLLLVTVPLVLVLVLLAPDVLELLLGRRWVPATDIYRALAVAAVLQLALSTNGWLYLSSGRTREQLRFTLWSRPLIVTGFLVGSAWGAVGVAVGYSVALAALFLPAVSSATRGTSVRPREVVRAFGLPLLAGAAALAAAWPVRLLVDGQPVAARAVLPALAGAAAVLAVAAAWRPLGERYREVARLLRG